MKVLIGILTIVAILTSGCVSTVNPVDPADVISSPAPFTIKEFQEQDISVAISNNGTGPIDSVKVASFDPLTVVSTGILNIPARTKEGPSWASISLKVQAPSFKTDVSNTAMTLSYASGKNDKGEPIIKTKSIPVQVTVLPDAGLQFVGFVKGPQNRSEAEVTSWEIGKGQNATITFSVKNNGKTTIDKNTLTVLVDIDNKEIGSNKTLTIQEGMAKGGTSYTEAVVLPVFKDAPNGETDVLVKLLMGDNVLDMKTIHLKVRL
ncbi:MAG: hypothetical protein O8C66_11755 [Candidatus Methanoperedens sp.]|nr:hypothetical protein [Candidatus Methanoperedens sp.]MCZ7371177.1 hypothetical protein [Candidatus Methanoperedens sp.]